MANKHLPVGTVGTRRWEQSSIVYARAANRAA